MVFCISELVGVCILGLVAEEASCRLGGIVGNDGGSFSTGEVAEA